MDSTEPRMTSQSASTSNNSLSASPKKMVCEEDIIATITKFSSLHGKMQFDKARELIEAERIRFASLNFSSSALCVWQAILNVLTQLVVSESSYYSLSFFMTKFSFRKENHLREVYVQLRNELQRCNSDGQQLLTACNSSNAKSPCELLIGITDELIKFTSMRIELIDFYIGLPSKDWRTIYEDGCKKLSELSNTYLTQNPPSCLHGGVEISKSYVKELTILCQLFRAQRTIVECSVMDSLIILKNLRNALHEWFSGFESVTPAKPSTSFFFLFTKKAKPTEKLALIHFLNQFYQALLAKFSLYFHDVLAKYVPQTDLKLAFTSNNNNFLHGFQNFHRKNSPQVICILVNRLDVDTSFFGFGYHKTLSKFNSECCKPMSGVNEKFPALFIYPPDKRVIEFFYANITSFVQDVCLANSRLVTTNYDGKVKYLYDKNKDQSFFAANIEASISMVVVYDRKVQERESVVLNFFNDVLLDLRFVKLFQDLRNCTNRWQDKKS